MAEYFPIVYVRGYAMTANEVEDTFNSPYYGFNLGAAKITLVNRSLDKNDLEMLILWLIKDEGYVDAFDRFVTASRDTSAPSNAVPSNDPRGCVTTTR